MLLSKFVTVYGKKEPFHAKIQNWNQKNAQSVLYMMIQSLIPFSSYSVREPEIRDYEHFYVLRANGGMHFCEGTISFQEHADTSLQCDRQGKPFY